MMPQYNPREGMKLERGGEARKREKGQRIKWLGGVGVRSWGVAPG